MKEFFKSCPCGLIPPSLGITEGSTFRWKYVTANCCGEWMLEFKVSLGDPGATIEKKAMDAWNAMPRKGDE